MNNSAAEGGPRCKASGFKTKECPKAQIRFLQLPKFAPLKQLINVMGANGAKQKE